MDCLIGVRFTILSLAFTACAACSAFANPVDGRNEIVLRPGTTLVAKTTHGSIRIEAITEERRHYTMPGLDRTLTLDARESPWLGSIGEYAAASPFSDTNSVESSYNFASLRALRYYLSNETGNVAYSSDGLYVRYGVSYNGSNFVEVQRLCVTGKPPIGLVALHGTSISLTHGETIGDLHAWYGCARTVYDPAAATEADIRSGIDISRQVDFWNDGNYSCAVNGGTSGQRSSTPQTAPTRGNGALSPGESISFTNRNGAISIDAPDVSTRTLRWHNAIANGTGFGSYDTQPRTATVQLAAEPPQAEYPAVIACTLLSGERNYIIDMMEDTLNFRSVDEFRSWTRWDDHGPLYLDYGYTSDGLLAGFSVGTDSGMSPMLNVDVYRICIGGQPAHALPGADGPRIRVSQPDRAAQVAACPSTALDVAGIFKQVKAEGTIDSPSERALRAYLGM